MLSRVEDEKSFITWEPGPEVIYLFMLHSPQYETYPEMVRIKGMLYSTQYPMLMVHIKSIFDDN